jgi:hypothetical protein
MRLSEVTNPAWRILMVYGSFNDPATGKNFFLVRIPGGRSPWTKKIAPAIDRLVRGLFSPEDIKADRFRRREGREELIHWNVEGQDDDSIWDIKQQVSRYEWTGSELRRVPI